MRRAAKLVMLPAARKCRIGRLLTKNMRYLLPDGVSILPGRQIRRRGGASLAALLGCSVEVGHDNRGA